jgi:siderophore synthetase component
MTQAPLTPREAVAHLRADTWAEVNRALIAKAIRELSHERLIAPEPLGQGGEPREYRLLADDPSVAYRFRAQLFALDQLEVEPASIRRVRASGDASAAPEPLDALVFFCELRETLALSPEVLPSYLEELSSTLASAAYKRVRAAPPAAELARAEFQVIERAMSEGHPCFIANNARLGFDASDYRAYAPEAAEPLQLEWLAVRRERTEFACVRGLTQAELIERELDRHSLDGFARTLRRRGLDPLHYAYLPVHPWQWRNKLAQQFAADLATGQLVSLGPGPDLYQPQQSIRTFYNISDPTKHYVKTSLSILNMGFTRGIPPTIARRAAAVNDWVNAVVEGDAYLKQTGFCVLRETACLGVVHRHYGRLAPRAHPAKELLAAFWRESPARHLQPRQRLMTMAALLHVDTEGRALLPALIQGSGLGVDAWLDRYLRAYLNPLVHCFYAHNLTFTPHCENTILVLEDDAPVRVIMKDLAEDVGVLNPEQPLPEAVRHLALRVPDDVMTLTIFTDVFDCVFRYLAPLLQIHAHYPEQRFWERVAHCIRSYEREQPHFAARYRRHDLFAPAFILNCLNRLQLRNNRQMVDLNAEDPVTSLQFAGTLANPIAALSPRRAAQPEPEESRWNPAI